MMNSRIFVINNSKARMVWYQTHLVLYAFSTFRFSGFGSSFGLDAKRKPLEKNLIHPIFFILSYELAEIRVDFAFALLPLTFFICLHYFI